MHFRWNFRSEILTSYITAKKKKILYIGYRVGKREEKREVTFGPLND